MNNKHIVWADDEIGLLKPHLIFMEEKGYRMTPVNSGEDAIRVCSKEQVDLLLIDEMMTGLDGIETINIIKKSHPHIPIIMVTKNEEEWLMEEAIGSFISDYLTKPVNPSQILIACKKVFEQSKIKYEKTLKDFLAFVNSTSNDQVDNLSYDDWYNRYNDLCNWSIKLDNIDDPNILEMFTNYKTNLNIEFTKYYEKNYKKWLLDKNIANTTAPILSHNVFDASLKPIIQNDRKLVFIIIDCFRMDQWKKISNLFYDDFLVNENYHYSIIPSATPFARNSIFSGMLPEQIKIKYPEVWSKMFYNKEMNGYEDVLFKNQLANKGFKNRTTHYTKIFDYKQGQKFINKINDYKNVDILNLVVNFVDILGHSRSESNILKELLPNESGYRQAIFNWFDKSWLKDAIKVFHNWGADIVITSDHGNISVNRPALVKADQTASLGVRYKYGRNLQVKQKNILKIDKPSEYMLPSFDVNTQYIIAKDYNFFVYNNEYHKYVNMYKNSFQHGGISLDEIIVPLIHLENK